MCRKWVVPIIVVILVLLFSMAAIAAGDYTLGEHLFLPLVSNYIPPTPTNTPIPTEPPPPQPTPTNEGVPSFCSCTGPDLDCSDFSTHKQAQASARFFDI